MANGALIPQTYIWATYNDGSCPNGPNGQCYAQDVAILSHEVGEWADDPSGHTTAPCSNGQGGQGWLEVGDPLGQPY